MWFDHMKRTEDARLTKSEVAERHRMGRPRTRWIYGGGQCEEGNKVRGHCFMGRGMLEDFVKATQPCIAALDEKQDKNFLLSLL